jgi:hypothetical protein
MKHEPHEGRGPEAGSRVNELSVGKHLKSFYKITLKRTSSFADAWYSPLVRRPADGIERRKGVRQ